MSLISPSSWSFSCFHFSRYICLIFFVHFFVTIYFSLDISVHRKIKLFCEKYLLLLYTVDAVNFECRNLSRSYCLEVTDFEVQNDLIRSKRFPTSAHTCPLHFACWAHMFKLWGLTPTSQRRKKWTEKRRNCFFDFWTL